MSLVDKRVVLPRHSLSVILLNEVLLKGEVIFYEWKNSTDLL